MSDWEEVKLGDIIELITDYHSNGSYETLKENVELLDRQDFAIMIRTTNFEQNDFSNNLKYISEHSYCFLKKSMVYHGDIIMNKIANAGSVYFMPNLNYPVSLAMNLFLIRINKENANQRFIFYYLKANEHYIKQFAEGSVTKTITKNAVRNLIIRKPSLKIQDEIVKVIENLENKIENLRRQNETLEQIAQTLFKHWFIDFEFPNADGKPYKSSGGAMFTSELGDIPEGWKVGKLKDICEIINGFAFKSEDYREEGIKIIRTKNFDETGSIVLDNLTYISNSEVSKYKKFQLNQFDFLMVMVGASIGKSVIVTSHILPALQNQNMWNFRAIDTSFQIFLNQSLKLLILKHSGSSTGSAREFFRKDYFYEIQITLPDNIIIYQFQKAGLALLAKIDLNIRQIQTLTKTRDSLLSKLMSGQLRVKE